MDNKIKLLRETLKKNGFIFKLLNRCANVVIYELFADYGSAGYEVHKVRLRPYPHLFLNEEGYTHIESLASNEEFGKYGWHYKKLKYAETQYNKLIEEGSKNE